VAVLASTVQTLRGPWTVVSFLSSWTAVVFSKSSLSVGIRRLVSRTNVSTKSPVIWDITPYSPFFGGNISRPSLGSLPATLFRRFLLGFLFDPEDEGDVLLRNGQLTFNGLYGIVSQKIELCKPSLWEPVFRFIEWLAIVLRFREVPGSNLGLESSFHGGFLQSFQATAQTVPQIRRQQLRFTSFQFITHWSPCHSDAR
jgi:hypothetical protein